MTRQALLQGAGAAVLSVSVTARAAAANGIRVGMIPDAGATQVSIDEKAPLRDYLSAKVGRPVELVIPTNYNATVEALGNGFLRLATGNGFGHGYSFFSDGKKGGGLVRAVAIFGRGILRFLVRGGFIVLRELPHPFSSGER